MITAVQRRVVIPFALVENLDATAIDLALFFLHHQDAQGDRIHSRTAPGIEQFLRPLPGQMAVWSLLAGGVMVEPGRYGAVAVDHGRHEALDDLVVDAPVQLLAAVEMGWFGVDGLADKRRRHPLQLAKGLEEFLDGF